LLRKKEESIRRQEEATKRKLYRKENEKLQCKRRASVAKMSAVKGVIILILRMEHYKMKNQMLRM